MDIGKSVRERISKLKPNQEWELVKGSMWYVINEMPRKLLYDVTLNVKNKNHIIWSLRIPVLRSISDTLRYNLKYKNVNR
jgi:hypothetical protein